MLHTGTLEQSLAALGQVYHTQMLARLGVAFAQGFQRGNGRVVDKSQMTAVQCYLCRVFGRVELGQKRRGRGKEQRAVQVVDLAAIGFDKIGRASCRERVF